MSMMNEKARILDLRKELEKYSLGLTPILENYIKYTSINFKELENTATPDSLRDLIEKFTAEDVVVKKQQTREKHQARHGSSALIQHLSLSSILMKTETS